MNLSTSAAWELRARRAMGWHLGQATPATIEQVAQEIAAWFTREVIERKERERGIDPETGAEDRATLASLLAQSRARVAELEAQLASRAMQQ